MLLVLKKPQRYDVCVTIQNIFYTFLVFRSAAGAIRCCCLYKICVIYLCHIRFAPYLHCGYNKKM